MEKGHDGQTDAIDKRLSVSAAADSRVVSTALGSAVSQPVNSSPTQVAFDIERRTAARLTQIMKKKKHCTTRRKKHSEEEKHTRPFSRD